MGHFFGKPWDASASTQPAPTPTTPAKPADLTPLAWRVVEAADVAVNAARVADDKADDSAEVAACDRALDALELAVTIWRRAASTALTVPVTFDNPDDIDFVKKGAAVYGSAEETIRLAVTATRRRVRFKEADIVRELLPQVMRELEREASRQVLTAEPLPQAGADTAVAIPLDLVPVLYEIVKTRQYALTYGAKPHMRTEAVGHVEEAAAIVKLRDLLRPAAKEKP